MMKNEMSAYIYEYEEVLLGRAKFSYTFSGSEIEKKDAFRVIWEYAITDILGWSPEEALLYMTKDVVKTLKLEKTLFVLGINENTFLPDYRQVLSFVFPHHIKYDFTKETLDAYEKSTKTNERLPKSFFTGENRGEERAKLILNHLVKKYFGDMTMKEKYAFFATKKKCRIWLKQNRIYNVIGLIFKTPLEYFHESLSEFDKDEFLYQTFRINGEINSEIE